MTIYKKIMEENLIYLKIQNNFSKKKKELYK